MAIMDMMIIFALAVSFTDDVSGQITPLMLNSSYNTSDLYGIVNQWAANLVPDFIVSVWSKMSSVEGLEEQNNNCLTGLNRIVKAFQNNDSAAARYFDSWGKPGAALLYGNIAYWGSYSECIDLKDTSIDKTDYCRFNFLATANYSSLPLQVGLCFPSVCSVSDFVGILNSSLAQINKLSSRFPILPVQFIVDPNKPPLCPWRDLDFDAGTIILVIACGILFILILLGSLVDGLLWYYKEWWIKPSFTSITADYKTDETLSVNSQSTINDKRSWLKILKDFILCFSVYKTVPEILGTTHPRDGITCINGIRVISMLWIILGHIFESADNFAISYNLLYSYSHTFTRFTFQVIANGFKGVDTFLLLSGLLLSYLVLREMDRRKGKIPFIFFYIFRFIRLSPLYYFIIFIWFKIFPHMASGPNWYWSARHNCEKYWWTNILYINNLYPREYTETCYDVTWYLAMDTQVFMITPIFLYLLYYCWQAGLVALLGTIFASWIATAVIVGVNDYHANFIKYALTSNSGIQSEPVIRDIYQAPYCRANSYLVGIILGFVLHKKWKPRGILVSILFYTILWIVGIICIVIPVYGLYPSFHGHTLSSFENVTYLTLSGTGFAVGVSCIIYVCHNGYGFLVNTILSWKFWIPLGRLTYAVYLLHIMILTYFFGSLHSRDIQDDYHTILWFVAATGWTYLIAFLFAIVIEFPFINLMIFAFKLGGLERSSQQSEKSEEHND